MKKYLWLFALDFMCFLGKVTLSGFKEMRMSKLVNGRAGHLLVVLAMLFLTGCGKVDLLSNLPEKEANEITKDITDKLKFIELFVKAMDIDESKHKSTVKKKSESDPMAELFNLFRLF